MTQRESAPAMTVLFVGVPVALGFALLIGLLPESLLLQARWRVVVYVACAAAAPLTGAMTFDGLAIGFAPFLYDQTGQALAWVASALIFAFASLVVAGQIMLGNRAPGTVHR